VTPTITSSPTPTATSTPTLLPVVANQAALVYPGEIPLREGEAYQVGTEMVQMKIYHRTDITNGFLLVMPGSHLTFDQVFTNDAQQSIILLRMDPHSQGFLETGGYNQADLIVSALNLRFSIQGCFAIKYSDPPSEVTASCYDNSCAYSLSSAEKITIEAGHQVQFDSSGQASDSLPIPVSDARNWASLLPAGSPAFNCANRLVPTPTPRPTITITPSATQEQGKSKPNTPLPPPSLTPPPPSATPSSTPQPPSATPQPPSATPQTPSPTTQPPTHTPTLTKPPVHHQPTHTPSLTPTTPSPL
jgi:hypothetical protein